MCSVCVGTLFSVAGVPQIADRCSFDAERANYARLATGRSGGIHLDSDSMRPAIRSVQRADRDSGGGLADDVKLPLLMQDLPLRTAALFSPNRNVTWIMSGSHGGREGSTIRAFSEPMGTSPSIVCTASGNAVAFHSCGVFARG